MPASVAARLRDRSRATGDDYQVLLTAYFFERFLFRLSRSPVRRRETRHIESRRVARGRAVALSDLQAASLGGPPLRRHGPGRPIVDLLREGGEAWRAPRALTGR